MDSTPAAVITLNKIAMSQGPVRMMFAWEPRNAKLKVRSGSTSSSESVKPSTFMPTSKLKLFQRQTGTVTPIR